MMVLLKNKCSLGGVDIHAWWGTLKLYQYQLVKNMNFMHSQVVGTQKLRALDLAPLMGHVQLGQLV